MASSARRFLVAAALLGGVAVAAGAFGAHALEGQVPPPRLATFETAARYAMYHALALLALALWLDRERALEKVLRWSGWCFLAGAVLFSGSLFVLVLADHPWLGAITPLGGVCFLAGWALLGVAAWQAQKKPPAAQGNRGSEGQ